MAAEAPIGWHSEDIKAALRKARGPITRLSQEWGYHRCAITKAISQSTYSTILEKRIARALNVSPFALWPDRWFRNGKPRPRADLRKSTGSRPLPHRQKRGAA